MGSVLPAAFFYTERPGELPYRQPGDLRPVFRGEVGKGMPCWF
jgi:hypothetical protein